MPLINVEKWDEYKQLVLKLKPSTIFFWTGIYDKIFEGTLRFIFYSKENTYVFVDPA